MSRSGLDTRPERKAGAFFGRRKAKPLSARQQILYDRLLPELRVEATGEREIAPGRLFGFSPSAIRLEIGFGGGEHLVREAQSASDVAFIGAEPFVNGIAKALTAIEERRLQNIRLFDADATLLLDSLPSNCLDRIDLLYPDPWPKRRHWKRRFVNEANLARISRVLVPGGQFRFASDIDDYVNWTLRHTLRLEGLAWTAARAADWRNAWPGWRQTRYEKKALREGRRPTYLVFEKQDGFA